MAEQSADGTVDLGGGELTPNPWAQAVLRTVPKINFGMAGESTLRTIPYPPITSGARLSSYSVPGLRLAKLEQRPSFIREVYGYQEQWNQTDQYSVRVFDVPCGGRKIAVDYWLGYSYATAIAGNYRISRTLPEQHPKYPWLYATDARFIEPQNLAITQDPFSVTDGGTIVPMIYYVEKVGQAFNEGAVRYAVTYRPLPYEILTDNEADATGVDELARYVERSFSFTVQAQPIPTTVQFKFTEGPYLNTSIPATNPQFIMPIKQCVYRWVEIPDLPHTAIDACVGKVNAESFDGAPGWPLYEAETLLCHAPQPKWYRTKQGRVAWDLTYRLDYRPSGWNKFLAADRNFYRATIGGTAGLNLYQTADFRALFRLPNTP